MFTLAHFSDPHLALPRKPALPDLINKRITGYLNLLRHRARKHQDWALELLLEDMKSRRPDHIALTGDLVNLSLPAEFSHTNAWLRKIGTPHQVSVIPGNHDAYVKIPEKDGIAKWADYMTGDVRDHVPAGTVPLFPYLRIRGEVGILGLSSAVTTLPFRATGKIGKTQLATAEKMLVAMKEQDIFRVLLVHHPVIEGQAPNFKRLKDADKLLEMVARTGVDLILHGHNHTDTIGWCTTPTGRAPVIGVPSASSIQREHRPPAQYNLYGIARDQGDWKIDMVSRRLKPNTRMFQTVRRMNLVPGSGDLNISIGEQEDDTGDNT